LETDLRIDGARTPLRSVLEGKVFHQRYGGMVGVANVGLDINWLHHPMAMANLYGFGRLAWSPELTPEQLAEEWTRQTWGNQANVVQTIDGMLLSSWRTFEDYTGPLGLGSLTDTGVHYGPDVTAGEHKSFGRWIHADAGGVGVDRTTATGSGFIGEYPPQLASKYEDLRSCPDDLLLFMHHVSYTYRLHSGETVLQHLYDAHYRGAETAVAYVASWEQLRASIDPERFAKVEELLMYQRGHAEVWRDAIDDWFAATSEIPDDKGRVGHHPDRFEAETMRSEGYVPVEVHPWETASGRKAAICKSAPCQLETAFSGKAGSYRIEVGYFDLHPGTAQYSLRINDRLVASFLADDILPPAQTVDVPSGDTATRYLSAPLRLEPGDRIRLEAQPDSGEPAPVDFLELHPIPAEGSLPSTSPLKTPQP
jgi:alpha-glucuronidase